MRWRWQWLIVRLTKSHSHFFPLQRFSKSAPRQRDFNCVIIFWQLRHHQTILHRVITLILRFYWWETGEYDVHILWFKLYSLLWIFFDNLFKRISSVASQSSGIKFIRLQTKKNISLRYTTGVSPDMESFSVNCCSVLWSACFVNNCMITTLLFTPVDQGTICSVYCIMTTVRIHSKMKVCFRFFGFCEYFDLGLEPVLEWFPGR